MPEPPAGSPMATKADLLLERDEKGRLLPSRQIIRGPGGKPLRVLVLPMVRGEMLQVKALADAGEKDTDLKVAKDQLLEPKLSDAEWDGVRCDPTMRRDMVTEIVLAVARASRGDLPEPQPVPGSTAAVSVPEADLKKT